MLWHHEPCPYLAKIRPHPKDDVYLRGHDLWIDSQFLWFINHHYETRVGVVLYQCSRPAISLLCFVKNKLEVLDQWFWITVYIKFQERKFLYYGFDVPLKNTASHSIYRIQQNNWSKKDQHLHRLLFACWHHLWPQFLKRQKNAQTSVQYCVHRLGWPIILC